MSIRNTIKSMNNDFKGSCKYSKNDSRIKISKYETLPINEEILKETIAKIGKLIKLKQI